VLSVLIAMIVTNRGTTLRISGVADSGFVVSSRAGAVKPPHRYTAIPQFTHHHPQIHIPWGLYVSEEECRRQFSNAGVVERVLGGHELRLGGEAE
jgi:hypothetical protein